MPITINNRKIKTVPNQRIVEINKAITDKDHLYTKNNLEALGRAAKKLQSIGGFKLYMYLAKNQEKYAFALSSADFYTWSGLSKQAYTTAFNELVKCGFLVQDKKNEILYHFYENSVDKEEEKDDTVIIVPSNTFSF